MVKTFFLTTLISIEFINLKNDEVDSLPENKGRGRPWPGT